MNEAQAPSVQNGEIKHTESQTKTAPLATDPPNIPDIPEIETPTPVGVVGPSVVEEVLAPAAKRRAPVKRKKRKPKPQGLKAAPKKRRPKEVTGDELTAIQVKLRERGDALIRAKDAAQALAGYPKRKAQITTKAALKVLVKQGFVEELVRGFYRLTPTGQQAN